MPICTSNVPAVAESTSPKQGTGISPNTFAYQWPAGNFCFYFPVTTGQQRSDISLHNVFNCQINVVFPFWPYSSILNCPYYLKLPLLSSCPVFRAFVSQQRELFCLCFLAKHHSISISYFILSVKLCQGQGLKTVTFGDKILMWFHIKSNFWEAAEAQVVLLNQMCQPNFPITNKRCKSAQLINNTLCEVLEKTVLTVCIREKEQMPFRFLKKKFQKSFKHYSYLDSDHRWFSFRHCLDLTKPYFHEDFCHV